MIWTNKTDPVIKLVGSDKVLSIQKSSYICEIKSLNLRYLNFCPEFWVHAGKRLDKNAKVNFKTYEVTDWETNNYNTHITQYLKK